MLNESDSPEIWGRRKTPTRLWLLDFLVSLMFGFHFKKSIWRFTFLYFANASELIIKKQALKEEKPVSRGLGGVGEAWAWSENHLEKSNDGI